MSQEARVPDYSKDKKGYVIYHQNGTKVKIKLRAYVRIFALKIQSYAKCSLTDAREILIEAYNKEGIPGIRDKYLNILLTLKEEMDATENSNDNND